MGGTRSSQENAQHYALLAPFTRSALTIKRRFLLCKLYISKLFSALTMDADGFALHSRRRGYSNRDSARDRDRETFLREVPKFAGTSEEFDRAHAKRYGREERLGPE